MITGGSRGLGLAISQNCVEAGARVVLLARDPLELERGRNQLLDLGFQDTSVRTRCCDLTLVTEVESAFSWIHSTIGPVDVLINNAGIIDVGPFENQALQSFHDSMDTNFFGALHCVRAVLPSMLARADGHIVNIASIGGLVSVPHLLPYSASKFALVGFSRGLGIELQPKGIRVLTVCPWLMRTGSHLQASFSGKRAEEYRWFSLGATFPGASMNLHDASRRIVKAVESGQQELLLSGWSVFASYLMRLAPSLMHATLSIANRLLLPQASTTENAPRKGFMVRQLEWEVVGRLGDKAASDWNQEA